MIHGTKLTVALAMAALLGACTTGSTKKDEAPTEGVAVEQMDIDPMLVRVKDGESMETETLDVEEVFQRAYLAYQSRRYEEAIKHYELVIEYFATTRFYLPSLYNGGLAYEQLQRWDDAVRTYRRIIADFPENKEAIDAHYRLANALSELGEHEQVAELMTELMLRDLSHFDHIEAHLRRSNALLELGQLTEAEQGFRTLIRLNDRASDDERLDDNANFLVQSHFGLGRVYHQRVGEIALKLPPERMGEDLERKAELFLTAQANYIRAVRQYHPHWSVAAGYMIGRLYEDFYVDMFTAEIPDDLTDEQVSMYFEELRKQIQPLMERAILVYERNLTMSQRIAGTEEANRWAEQSATHLTRLRAFLNDPWTQRRAERLVLEGRSLHELWDSQGMARDIINDALRNAQQESAKDDLRM